MNDLVSVILPTYNRAHTLLRAANSVLNQTYKNFELIIIDDCSTDNTEEVVKNIHDERIVYIRQFSNKGAAAARNTGIKIAKGDYVAFQDSDDEWLPEKLEKQMNVFKSVSLEVGVVYTGFWRIEKGKKIYIPATKTTKKEVDIHNKLLKGNFITTQVAVVKKECFKKLGGFDERLPRLQDWELWIRISEHYGFYFIDEALAIVYLQKESISMSIDALKIALDLIEEKYFNEFMDQKINSLSDKYCWLARLLIKEGRFSDAQKNLSKSIFLYRFNLKAWVASLFLILVFVIRKTKKSF